MTPTQLLKEIRRVPNLSRTQAVTLAQLTKAERKGRLQQAQPLLKQLQRAKASPEGMTWGMQRAWLYAQLTHPEQFQERKAEAIAVAKRLEYDEIDDRDRKFIGQLMGVRV
jgi:hypothetical protein